MATRCNGKDIPITIAINHDYGNDKVFTHLSPGNVYFKQDSYIVLNEGLNTGIKFFADSPEHFDEEARIEIQTSLYDNTDTQETLVYPLSLNPNVNWLYRHSDNSVFPWRMGTYYINVYYKGQVYTTSVFVEPLYLSKEQVKLIHEYLDSKIEGVIYDLIYSNEGLTEHEGKNLTNWYYDYARYMTKNKESIFYYLMSLEKSPVFQIISKNEVSLIQGKVNKRSIKWSYTNKGMEKNSNFSGNYYFNQIKKEVFDHNANRWMKNILSIWSADLNHVIGVISNSHDVAKKKLRSLRQEISTLHERREYLRTKREVSKTTEIDVKTQIKIIEKEVQKHCEVIALQEMWMKNLSLIFSRIVYLLNNSFMRDIGRGKIKPTLKKNCYYQLNSIYEDSKLFQKEKGDKKNYIKILKPFWQIYEYYCLFTILDSLNKMGFKMKTGFQPNFLELYHQSMIPSDSFYVLENDRAVIHCWYDKYHGDKFSAEQKGELFFSGQEKKRPDIKLDLYEKSKDGELLFRSCLILDAKFRKLSNMHNNDYATTTYHQLTSYYSFFYLGSNSKSRRGQVVQQVICLYGSEHNSEIKKTVEPLLYIKLFPEIKENGGIETKGEREVLEELHTWLEDLLDTLH